VCETICFIWTEILPRKVNLSVNIMEKNVPVRKYYFRPQLARGNAYAVHVCECNCYWVVVLAHNLVVGADPDFRNNRDTKLTSLTTSCIPRLEWFRDIPTKSVRWCKAIFKINRTNVCRFGLHLTYELTERAEYIPLIMSRTDGRRTSTDLSILG
jgi:hypothetical protein